MERFILNETSYFGKGSRKVLISEIKKRHFENVLVVTDEELFKSYAEIDNRFTENTAIGVIFTNAKFDKIKLSKIAEMAQNGYARAIRPVHTSEDGDTIYAASIGDIKADIDVVGTLASRVMSEAIINAVNKAETDYGYPSAKDLNNYDIYNG